MAAFVAVASTAALSVAAACAKRVARPIASQSLDLTEYVIPWENAFPSDVVVDSTGVLWFTDRVAQVIGRFDPELERFEAIVPPSGNSAPYGMVVAPDGGLWYAGSGRGLVGRIDPATNEITEYPIPGASGGPHLIVWTGGQIWFSLRQSKRIGRFDPRSGAVRLLETPPGVNAPYSAAVTQDGHVWFDTRDAWKLLEVDPRADMIEVHDLTEPPPAGQPWGWYTGRDANGRPKRVAVATREEADALADSLRSRVSINGLRGGAKRMTAGPDGSLWITDWDNGRVVRYDPRSGGLTPFASLAASSPYGVAVSSSGQVWYGDKASESIVILDPRTGQRASVELITPGGVVRDIAIDERRGRVWLPISDKGRIGLITITR